MRVAKRNVYSFALIAFSVYSFAFRSADAVRAVVETDIDRAGSEAAEEVALAGPHGVEVAFPLLVLGEVCKSVVALDHVTWRSLVVVVRQRLSYRCHLPEQTRHRAPLSLTLNGHVH